MRPYTPGHGTTGGTWRWIMDEANAMGEDGEGAARQKREVADLYSHVAASYDAVGPAVFARFGERVVVVAGIREGARVLDVGAGRGASLFPAAGAIGATGEVVGIDIAAAMVEETGRAIRERKVANASMLRIDAEELGFSDASFDYVLCSFAYFFFPHLERALGEFHRVLRPGGTVLLTAHGGTDERWQWYETQIYETLLVATYARHGLTFPRPVGGGHRGLDELQGLLAGAGFSDMQRIPVEVEAVYADADEWWAAKRTHGARRPLEAMPEEVLRGFVAEVDARLESLREADGLHERWRVVCVQGKKITLAESFGSVPPLATARDWNAVERMAHEDQADRAMKE